MSIIYDLIINIIELRIVSFAPVKQAAKQRRAGGNADEKEILYDSFLWMHNFD